jgi:hypothetical protein
VRTADRSASRRFSGVVIAAVALCLSVPTAPAAAGSLFETLFGVFRGQPAPREQTSPGNSYADPLLGDRHSAGESSYGRGTAFCVRTCDGRYFPLQRVGGASPVDICHTFCPASRTMVFSGSKIDSAVAPNGTRYADLDTAFAYRDRLVKNCTCTGKNGGLAHLDTINDPTLRPGDIVATDSGLAAFTGRGGRSAEFTPINQLSGEWAHRLSEIKVRPAPPAEKIEPVANNEVAPVRQGRVQASR